MVADRWHLLANMRQAVERWLHTTHARLRRLPASSADVAATPITPHRDQAFRRTSPERAARAESRTRWQARYEEVRHRHRAGEPLLTIARAMGLARATVRKFARAESFPARLPRGPGPSIIDPFLPHLERRLAKGCENGLVLWRHIATVSVPQSLDTPGSYLNLLRFFLNRRRFLRSRHAERQGKRPAGVDDRPRPSALTYPVGPGTASAPASLTRSGSPPPTPDTLPIEIRPPAGRRFPRALCNPKRPDSESRPRFPQSGAGPLLPESLRRRAGGCQEGPTTCRVAPSGSEAVL